MTPGQRLKLTLEMSRAAWKALCEGDEEIIRRRILRRQQENDLRNQRITEGLLLAEQRMEQSPGKDQVDCCWSVG
ncbi:MAG: hypothetical protein KF752_20155 [Pirellulaceae bacterium]|nr:hypothetical protein [Pirellulaceae bacterium]